MVSVFKDGQFAGYVFSSFEVSGSIGFSGKPLNIQIGLAKNGIIASAKLVRQAHVSLNSAPGKMLPVTCLTQIQVILLGFGAAFMFAIQKLNLLTGYQPHFHDECSPDRTSDQSFSGS